jgi:putative oxidoreductase
MLSPLLTNLAPVIEALLRAMVGVALVPHGLRVTFGFFRGTGLPASNLALLVAQLDRDGYRPGRLWAPAISLTELVAGPLLALGLFTRIAAVPVVIFLAVSCWERWHKGGWFWNTQGLEYTLMWTLAAAYFLAKGGGVYSVDYLLFGR